MPIVFVFDEGGHVAVFPSVDQAQGPIESEDVASGFYRDAFTETGAVVNITAGDRLFATIAVTEEIRPAEFRRLLAESLGPRHLSADPVAYAAE